MKRPNLFEIATEELAQDVFLTWLLRWAAPEYVESDRELHECGVAFVKLLLGKEGDTGFRVEKIEAQREKKHIDVRAKVNDRYTIIIEDKTRTNEHSRQLERYREQTLKECEKDGTELRCVYVKTTGMPRATRLRIEGKGYMVVDRKRLLALLEGHGVENVVYRDYVEWLRQTEAAEESWQTLPIGKWFKESWTGFYQRLDEVMEGEGWGYVSNPSQGFMGLWWNFREWRGCQMYWQIEQGKLCLKIGEVKEEERQRLRGECWSVVSRHAKERGLSEVIKRPGRFGLGASMTVAVVERQVWLGADGSLVDVEAVVERLKEYGRFLDECVK